MGEVSEKNIKVSKKLEENVEYMKRELGVDVNFDVVYRDLHYAGRDFALFFIDGFAKDQIMLGILRSLEVLRREEMAPFSIEKLVKTHVNNLEVEAIDTLDKILYSVLSGALVLFVDGEEQAVLIDAREYPARGPEEPDLERVVRGSRDGFTETLVFNTALIRRRIRDPQLRIEILQAGKRSKTDICVIYLADVANQELVNQVKERLQSIKIDGLPMAEKSVEELITPGSYWNPFPKVRYTERADVAATHLLEGHILVLVDTSPSVMILPATFFHHVQHAEEFRQSPFIGGFLRWVRFIGILASIFLVPLWLLISLEPRLLPEGWAFIGPEKVGQISLVYQFLLAEVGINLMRMAAIHTPTALATALGLIAAVLIGDIAVSIGLFAPEVVLYEAIAAVGTFATPSYELGMANTVSRIFLIIAVGMFRLPGLIVASAAILVLLAITKSFGIPYLWPLIPFNAKALGTILLRSPVPIQNTRPSILKPKDPDRQPGMAAAKPLKPGDENQDSEKGK